MSESIAREVEDEGGTKDTTLGPRKGGYSEEGLRKR